MDEVDEDKNLSINPPVDRLGLLTKSQRRRRREHKLKVKEALAKKEERKKKHVEGMSKKEKLEQQKLKRERLLTIKKDEDES